MFRTSLVIFSVAFLLLALLALRISVFTVDRAEYVYVTRFGRHVATLDGANADEAGLHFKWPWPVESVQRYDLRLQYFDLPPAELMTRDAAGNTIDRTLTVDAYVCWRIAGPQGVDRFIRSVGSPEGARAILGQRISSEIGAAIGALELEDLVSVKDSAAAGEKPRRWVDAIRDRLRQRLLDSARAAQEEYGIEVLDVRLRRVNHSASARQAIFDRIISEREKKAAEYQSDGVKRAADIESESVRKIAVMKAAADAEAVRLRGEADAEADRIRNEAQLKDPQFYSFLKKLDEYQRILGDNKTVLLLSTHREMFDALFDPPKPTKPAKKD
jgi:membrane protease subunit HflC